MTSNQLGRGIATCGWLGLMGWLVQLGALGAADATVGGLLVLALLWGRR